MNRMDPEVEHVETINKVYDDTVDTEVRYRVEGEYDIEFVFGVQGDDFDLLEIAQYTQYPDAGDTDDSVFKVSDDIIVSDGNTHLVNPLAKLSVELYNDAYERAVMNFDEE